MAEKGQLPKAYLRADPNLDQHPDPGAMVILMCEANRQPERGRFKALDRARSIIGRKRMQACVDRGDLVAQPDGRWLLSGWDEWQEGDFTVGERMARLRAKKRNKVTAATVTPPSPGPSLNRNGPSKASGVKASGTETATDPASPALPLAIDPPWNRDAADLWAAVYGGGAPGPLFAALKPGVKSYTWERIKPVLRWYLDQTPLEYVNVAKFVSGFPSMESRMKAGTTTAIARGGRPSVGETAMSEAQKFLEGKGRAR